MGDKGSKNIVSKNYISAWQCSNTNLFWNYLSCPYQKVSLKPKKISCNVFYEILMQIKFGEFVCKNLFFFCHPRRKEIIVSTSLWKSFSRQRLNPDRPVDDRGNKTIIVHNKKLFFVKLQTAATASGVKCQTVLQIAVTNHLVSCFLLCVFIATHVDTTWHRACDWSSASSRIDIGPAMLEKVMWLWRHSCVTKMFF